LETKELVKLALVFFLYGMVAPMGGLLLWKWRALQKPAFALVCFMTIGGFFQAAEWGFTLAAFEYRGHTKGYHFFFAEVLALSIVLASLLENWRQFRWFPPGLWAYFLYCGLSFLSIFSAPESSYVLMSAFKWLKVVIIFLAAFHFIRTEQDVHFFLKAMCVTMTWQLVAVLKMKYWDGIYQVPGTFEHQNSLSMFTTMIAMVFLAASLGPRHPHSNWYLFGFLACAAIQQSTLSRGGLAVFAFGTMAVAILSLVDKFDRRRFAVLSILTVAGIVGLSMTMDTIVERFQDESNEASAKTRELLAETSKNMLRDYPLGVGWNNYGITINKPFPYGRIIDDWEREGGVRVDENAPKGISESHYWLLLAETGYQGFVGYLIFILVFFWRNLRAMISYRYHFIGSISLGIATGLGCNYLQSVLERVLTQPRNMMLWMLLLGITARIEVWRRAAKRKRKETPRQETKLRPAANAR
jgi:hypothetical protein